MAKFAYEKAHADIVKYDNSDLLQTRSGGGSDDTASSCNSNFSSKADCDWIGWNQCKGLAQIDQGMPDPTL